MSTTTTQEIADNANANEGDIMSVLADKSVKEIKDDIRAYNEEHDLSSSDEGYLPLSGRKDELIQRLGSVVGEVEATEVTAEDEGEEEVEAAGNAEEEVEEVADPVIEAVKDHAPIKVKEHRVLELGQIRQNPNNPRHEEDYLDEPFIKMLKEEGGLGDALTVRPAGFDDDGGRPVFYPVSGNRRRFNLIQALDRGLIPGDWDSYPVDVIVRETEGDERAVLFDEIGTLVNMNENQWPLSPVDKFNAMQVMLRIEGVNQTDVADKLNVRRQYVSKMQKLADVPGFIRDYVHHSFNAKRYAASRTPEQLEQSGIRFIELEEPDEEGNTIEVQGIPMNTALEIATLFRRLAKGMDEEEVENFRGDFETFLLESDHPWAYRSEEGTGVIDAAINLSTRQFKGFLLDAATEYGLVEVEEPAEPPVEKGPSGTQTLDLSGAPAGEEGGSKAATAPTTVSDSDAASMSTDEVTDKWEEIASELEGGTYKLNGNIGWERKLADDLRFGNEDAIHAFNWMVDAKLLTN